MSDVEDDYEPSEDLVSRAGGGYLSQVVKLGGGADFPMTVNLTRTDSLTYLPYILYIRFVIKAGNVRLKIDFGRNWEVTMQQTKISTWFSAFSLIEKPRPFREGWKYPIKMFKEGGDVIISFYNFRSYKIFSNYPVDQVDIVLTTTLRNTEVDYLKPLQANYMTLSDVFSGIEVKGSEPQLPDPVLSFNDLTSKLVYPVSLGTRVQPYALRKESDVDFKNVKPPPAPEPEKSENTVNFNNTTPLNNVYRVYYTWTLPHDFSKGVLVSFTFPKIFVRDVTVLQQLWYGLTDGNVETFVELKPNSEKLSLGVSAWKDKVFGDFKIDDSELKKLVDSPGSMFTHHIVKDSDGVLIIGINGVDLVKTRHVVRQKIVSFGWEFHIANDLIEKYGKDNFARFADITKPAIVKVDGVDVSCSPSSSESGEFFLNGHKLEKVNVNKFRNLSEAANFFNPLPPPTPKPNEDGAVKPVVDLEGNKEVSLIQDQSAQSTVLPTEKSKLVSTNHFTLSPSEDKNIFERVIEKYQSMGFSKDQAKLIIYQLGVTFGTSRNCMGDSVSSLVWTTNDGQNVKLSKGTHSSFLNSLSKRKCNVERELLRRRSSEILALLRARRLVYPERLSRKKGMDYPYSYMACDFLDYSTLSLTQEELLALNSGQQYVRLHNKHRRSIVNVSQLY